MVQSCSAHLLGSQSRKHVQGFLIIRGFGFTRLGKLINIKKIVLFSTCTQIYTVFGLAKAKIFRFTMRSSVIHDFQAHSSEFLFLHNSRFTRRFQEHNPACD